MRRYARTSTDLVVRPASARSALLAWCLSRTLRPVTARWVPDGRQLLLIRTIADAEGILRLPFSAKVRRVEEDSVKGLWVSARRADEASGVILYVHGGGFVFGSSRSHFGIAKRLSEHSGLAVFLLDYRRAPEHVFPSAADDTLAAYLWLLDSGINPSRITVAGDSVGGHLVASLVGDLVRQGRPLPAALLMFSPALDIVGDRAVAADLERPDPVLSTVYGLKCFQAYLAGTHPLHPRLAVLSSPKHAWPPTLIQVGESECLLEDSKELAATLRAAGVPVELQIWPGQVHVFQLFARWLPQARAALSYGGDFLRERVHDAPGQARRYPPNSGRSSRVSGQ